MRLDEVESDAIRHTRCGVWPSPSPRSHHMDVLKPHAGAVQRTTSDRSRGRLSLSRGWDWEWVVCVWEIGRAMPVDSPVAQRVVAAATCMRALRRQWTYRTVAGWAPSAGSHSHEYPQLGFAPRRLFPQRPFRAAPCSARNHAHPTGTGLSGTGEASTAARAGRCVGGRARRVHHSLCRGRW